MNTLFDRASAAFVEFENLLIAEIIAGNTITGTPAAACGRVAPRYCLRRSSVADGQSLDADGGGRRRGGSARWRLLVGVMPTWSGHLGNFRV
jgi:hypothetical protein